MSSRYQITEKRMSDAINAFHNGDYTNPTAAARAFGVSAKTVHRSLDGRASKSSRLPSNRALNLELEQALRDYIQRLDEQNVSAKVSMIRAVANYILTKSHSDYLTPPLSREGHFIQLWYITYPLLVCDVNPVCDVHLICVVRAICI